jgi:hypothetical protein
MFNAAWQSARLLLTHQKKDALQHMSSSKSDKAERLAELAAMAEESARIAEEYASAAANLRLSIAMTEARDKKEKDKK